MQLYFDPDFPSRSLTGSKLSLNADESWHIAKVLRMRQGNPLAVTNGNGWLFTAMLTGTASNLCEVEVVESLYHKTADYSVHLAVAPIKNMARYEWFLEKATEVGINKVTPLICKRSEKISLRTERLEKVVVAALKQSFGVYLPKLNKAENFSEFINRHHEGEKFIGWCETITEPLLTSVCKPKQDVVVMIGPEGDFTHEEVKCATIAGFIPISLGSNRLRTETAALAATFAIHFVNARC